MIARLQEGADHHVETSPRPAQLWTGPSRLTTIRTAPLAPFQSLLKPTFDAPTAFRKRPREGRVHLGLYGFDSDERAYPPHQNNSRAVLQYNPGHYPDWKRCLKDINVPNDVKRDALLDVGGFGENISVEDSPGTPSMDETTMCIGDLVAFQGADGTERARIRLNGPRLPCFKINHRFGIPSMSQQTQDTGWTGWLYHVEKEGDVEVGDQMVLLERPFPEWTVSRIQHYCSKEPENVDMARLALETLGNGLASDVQSLFRDRLKKDLENRSMRMKGKDREDIFTRFRLCDKRRETDRVSEFVFERVDKRPLDANDFIVATSGSYVRLRFTANGQKIIRPYSVITGDSNTIHLGIALADTSRGGSTFMHHDLRIGDNIEMSDTFANTFALDTAVADKHVFLAGGIGITAFLDHVRYCLATKRAFHLHYMIRNESDYAFQRLIEDMLSGPINGDLAKLTVYVSAGGRRCDVDRLLSNIAHEEKTHIYVCGSERLSDAVQSSVQKLKIADSRVHFERFSVDASGDSFTVITTESQKTIEVNDRDSLLETLRKAGLVVASSCEAGNCGTCRVRVRRGRILHRGTGLMDDEKAGHDGKEDGEMLSCVSRGIGTITIEV